MYQIARNPALVAPGTSPCFQRCCHGPTLLCIFSSAILHLGLFVSLVTSVWKLPKPFRSLQLCRGGGVLGGRGAGGGADPPGTPVPAVATAPQRRWEGSRGHTAASACGFGLSE